ncbi:uncharacterized protein LOC127862518 isoform X2 [Dreissena polymorpha]|uniref:uncharacterized protein LOC127862518 isoform X2 n=1 Tax=Dreissena polymorpha TaxID=45954 RepID=UPI0022640ABF|nr:uncharacterized protein LOC127862518 isoform X2 [Dreissena polymorpha]
MPIKTVEHPCHVNIPEPGVLPDQTLPEQIYYDFSYQLVRFDYRRRRSTGHTTNLVTEIHTEIHDYRTGIAYTMDKTRVNCSVRPIQNASFFTSVTQKPDAQVYIHMKAASQLLYLDNKTYSYEGQRTVRGMLCDVYISKRTDFTLPNISINFTSTFEFYFWIQRSTRSDPYSWSLRLPTS